MPDYFHCDNCPAKTEAIDGHPPTSWLYLQFGGPCLCEDCKRRSLARVVFSRCSSLAKAFAHAG